MAQAAGGCRGPSLRRGAQDNRDCRGALGLRVPASPSPVSQSHAVWRAGRVGRESWAPRVIVAGPLRPLPTPLDDHQALGPQEDTGTLRGGVITHSVRREAAPLRAAPRRRGQASALHRCAQAAGGARAAVCRRVQRQHALHPEPSANARVRMSEQRALAVGIGKGLAQIWPAEMGLFVGADLRTRGLIRKAMSHGASRDASPGGGRRDGLGQTESAAGKALNITWPGPSAARQPFLTTHCAPGPQGAEMDKPVRGGK